MRYAILIRSFVASLLLFAPPALAAVGAGDLLVTDQNGARVLVVDPDTGNVKVLSPPSAGPNLLVSPTGIAMSKLGIVYVVDQSTDQLVGIDASNGAQFVVREIGGSPVSVGSEPFGLALRDSEAAVEFWVSARGSAEIRAIIGLIGFGITSFPLVQDARFAKARGIALAGDALYVAMDDGQGYYTVALDDGSIGDPLLSYDSWIPELPPIDESPDVPAWDVEPYGFQVEVSLFETITFHTALSLRDTVLIPPGIPACKEATSRIIAYGTSYRQLDPVDPTSFASGTLEAADGTPLHCPTALVTGLDGALYATDSVFSNGAGSQLVQLWPGTILAPQIVAALPDSQSGVMFPGGLAVAPVSVPEPGAGAAQLALLASMLILGRFRCQARWRSRDDHSAARGVLLSTPLVKIRTLPVLLLLLAPFSAHAVIQWPGAPPCDGTLQACVTAAAVGETIEVSASTPIAESITIEKSLTLVGNGSPPLPHIAAGNYVMALSPATGDHHVRIENLVIDDGWIGIAHGGTGSFEVEVVGNSLYSTGWEAIRVWTGTSGPPRGPLVFELAFNDIYMPNGSGERYGILLDVSMATQVTGTVRRNDVFFGANDQGSAMELANGGAAMSLSVTDNVVWGAGFDRGIFVYQYGTLGSIDALLAGNIVTGATIGEGHIGTGIAVYGNGGSLDFDAVNNTVAGNEVGLFVTGRPDLGASVTGLVANNAITDNSLYGFGVKPALWPSVANRNNLDSENGTSGEGPTYDPGPGTVTVPAQLDAGNFYRPLPTSPVRDAGDSSAVPVTMTVDFNGNPRIQGSAVDIGAYELPEPDGAGTAAAAFAMLASLAVTRRR